MQTETQAGTFTERLVPGPGLFIGLFMLAPMTALVMIAISTELAIPVGLAVYALVMTILMMTSPVISVENGVLTAGRARIPVEYLGDAELLGEAALRQAIGLECDARAYLLIRGWIHSGVRIANIDPADPAPYWVLTTRRPQALADAIKTQQADISG